MDISKIHEKLEKLDERLDDINTKLAVYNEQLKIHIKRSDLLETDLKQRDNNFQAELKPITKHVNMVQGAGKFLGLLALVSGIVITVIRILK